MSKSSIIRFLSVLSLLVFCLCGCVKEMDADRHHGGSVMDADTKQANAIIGIDASELIRVSAPGCLPINTESIKTILSSTGRFAYNRISWPGGGGAAADVYFELDKPDGDNAEGAAQAFYQVLDENTTQMISYNFSKTMVHGDKHDAVRWGLDLLLRIFGTALTDEIWADILAVAAKSETEDAWGTDYAGYADEATGIRLIYANLGSNVQIDIKPY